MDIIGAVIVLAFVGLGSVALVYTLARRTLREFENDKREYQQLVGNLLELEIRVQDEADQWPIFARPLLFTDIDHETQVEFAQAQRALSDAYEISPELKNISEYPFVKPSFFAIPDNLRTIATGSKFRLQNESLAYKIIDLAKSILAIRSNQSKIEQKRNLVRTNIRNLQFSIDQATKQVKKIEKGAGGLINLIYWSVQVAQDAHTSATLELKPKANAELEDDQGDLSYATADVYIIIGNIALKCFHLYVESLREIGRYDLDLFMRHFKESTDHLKDILEISDISGWKKLRRAKEPIDEFPKKEALAEKSLEDFREKRLKFETVEKMLSKIIWDEKISFAKNVQQKCMRYWSPYHEDKSEWVLILGNRILPETSFIQLRDQYISEILPETGSGVIIQQSRLPALISKISTILNREKNASGDIDKLNHEYQRNWDAEEQVRALVTRNGDVYVKISNVHNIIQDSDDDIIKKGNELHDLYKGYIDRINRVRGANFPELLLQCKEFVMECENLIEVHRTRVVENESKYKRLVAALQSSLGDLQMYIDMSPSLDRQHIERLEQLETTCKLLLESPADKRYLTLRYLVGRIEEWQQTGVPFIRKTKARVNNFKMLCEKTQNKIIHARATINNNLSRAERKIGWSNEEMTAVVEQAGNNLEKIISTWNRYIEFDWPEMSIQKASADCQNIMSDIDNIIVDMNNALDKVNRELVSYQKWANEISQRGAANAQQISAQDSLLISNLCQIGMRAPTRDFAKRSLELAEELATDPISARLRYTAQVTINDYKRIISTNGGSYIEGGVNINDQGQFNN